MYAVWIVAGLTFSADNQSRAYGADNPQLTFTVSGLRNDDPAAQALQGALVMTADANSPVGNDNITRDILALTTFGAARYTLLTFNPAPLTVRANWL